MFACELAGVTPDIMCLSKGLTGGFLPFAATLCSDEVHAAFLAPDRMRTLFHGHSYAGNPLGCAAALASLEIFEFEPVFDRIRTIERIHRERLPLLGDSPRVGETRMIGTIAAIELKTDDPGYLSDMKPVLYDFFIKRGLLLRPLGNVIYIMPPYVIQPDQLHYIYDVVAEANRTCRPTVASKRHSPITYPVVPAMRITTWNVNSIRRRIDAVHRWVEAQRPDVLCLQETRCTEDKFPRNVFASLGYTPSLLGQPTYNGVAILSRWPQMDVDTHPVRISGAGARSLAATIQGIRVINVYVPYGEAVGTSRFELKLEWLGRLKDALDASCPMPVVACGDFNVAPDDRDVYDPRGRHEKLICSTPERTHFDALLSGGTYVDALRCVTDEGELYTWWSHRVGAVEANRRLRVDHHRVHRSLAEDIESVTIDVEERRRAGSSDHAHVTLGPWPICHRR